MTLRFLSCFSGIEAASVAWKPLGWTCVGVAEVEQFPCAVLAHHYPGVPNLGDVTADDFIDRAKALTPDVLVGGSPCQSFSVAGLRGGLDDARGNLTLRFLQIAAGVKPKHIVWENVPGILSSNDGKDFTCFLDGLEEIGYVCDVDILNAQFFGLAQRRRRVFVWAHRADSILSERTLTSGLTIAQCLIEISLLISASLSGQFLTGCSSLAFDASEPCRSLQRRMQLFGLVSATAERVSLLAESLAAIQAWSECELSGSAWASGNEVSRISADTRSSGSSEETEAWRGACLSTGPSWSEQLADLLQTANECITSTATSATTESKIYSCAQTTLRITALITRSMHSCPSFWSAASSASTAIEAFTNYARSAGSDLFAGVERVRSWWDFLAQAEPALLALRGLGDRPDTGEVLSISKSLRGNTAPRRESREGTTGTLSSRTTAGGGLGTDFECSGGLIAEVVGALPSGGTPNGHGTAGVNSQAVAAGHVIAQPIPIAGTLEASLGRSRGAGTPVAALAAIAFQTRIARNGRGYAEDVLPTLSGADAGATSDMRPCVAVAFQDRFRGDDGRGYDRPPPVSTEQTGTLETIKPWNVASGTAVRRLTPTECERLQGFPDDWTAIPYRGKPAADGPRYRSLGNSMAVPCMAWIGRRIAAREAAIHGLYQEAAD